MTAMDEILFASGSAFFTIGVLAGLHGWTKAAGLKREDFRWDIDLDRARRRIRRAALVVVAWAFAAGAALVSSALFL